MRFALIGTDIFDGESLYSNKALLLENNAIHSITDVTNIPDNFQIKKINGGTLMPGFVDLQVNGGGGVLFNDETSLEGLITISNAHLSTGTRAFLPTLITDTPDKSRAAVDAVVTAIEQNVPGILGIHFEGPHISVARKGAHSASLIRKMDTEDVRFLLDTANRLANVMVTVAPENVTFEQIKQLSNAGIIISLGHTNCSFQEATQAFHSGAKCVTHLFNAMSQIGNREPGLVGAALHTGSVSAGLIADDIHVHAASMRLAIASKLAPGHIFLVTDAMATVGSTIEEFTLNNRKILRRNGSLRLEDGTLAGADLTLTSALSLLINKIGIDKDQVLAMATSYPAKLLNNTFGFGTFKIGQSWNGIHLDSKLSYSTLNSIDSMLP